MDSQLPAIHAVITQAISALSESDREHLLSSLTTMRAGPTAVEVSTVDDLTGRIYHIPPPDSENSAVSRHESGAANFRRLAPWGFKSLNSAERQQAQQPSPA